MKNTKELNLFIKNNIEEIPLVLLNLTNKKNIKTNKGKSIKIEKFRTNKFSINSYYKSITKFI
jgi:hypothetical protein